MGSDIEPRASTSLTSPAALAVAGYLGSLRQGSQRAQATALRTVAEMLGKQDAFSVDWHLLPPAVLDSVRSRLSERYAPATTNRHLAAIRGVLRQAWRHGLIDADTRDRLRDLPRVSGSRLAAGRDIPPDEQARLLRCCAEDTGPAGARDAAMLGLLLGCGLRRAEVAGLTLEDLDRGEMSLRVIGKGDKQRKVWLTNGTAQAMLDWLQVRSDIAGPLFCPILRGGKVRAGLGMTSQAIYLMLESRSKCAGIPAVRPHDCRRTFVGSALDRGIDISTVASLVGHASVQTTQRYDRRGERAKQSAMQTIAIPYTGRLAAVARLTKAVRDLDDLHTARLERLRKLACPKD